MTTTTITDTTTTTNTSCTSTTCTTGTFSSRLDAEWNHLRTARASLARARTWAVVRGELTDLGQIIDATQQGASPAGSDDATLLRLVELARHDELAGRLLIQRLLPGLISRSLAYRDVYPDLDVVELVVAGAWLAVHSFDTERRRRQVAASLISDAVFQTFRKPLRRKSTNDELRSPHRFNWMVDEDLRVSAFEELAAVVHDARQAGVASADLDLIRQLVRTGSPQIVAQQRNVTARTVRNHRARAIDHIRAALDPAA
jgi:hypothetical protein